MTPNLGIFGQKQITKMYKYFTVAKLKSKSGVIKLKYFLLYFQIIFGQKKK